MNFYLIFLHLLFPRKSFLIQHWSNNMYASSDPYIARFVVFSSFTPCIWLRPCLGCYTLVFLVDMPIISISFMFRHFLISIFLTGHWGSFIDGSGLASIAEGHIILYFHFQNTTQDPTDAPVGVVRGAGDGGLFLALELVTIYGQSYVFLFLFSLLVVSSLGYSVSSCLAFFVKDGCTYSLFGISGCQEEKKSRALERL